MGEVKEIKKEADEEAMEEDGSKGLSYEEKLENVNTIAKPMASKKLTKKIYKCIKKGIYFRYISTN